MSMDSSLIPQVIVRYDNEQSRRDFEVIFGQDFAITPFSSDATALAHLDESGRCPAAVFMLSDAPTGQDQSAFLLRVRDAFPTVLKILICDSMPLDLLVSLLDRGLVDACFERPFNPDPVRSKVLTAALTAQATPPVLGNLTGPVAGVRPVVLIVDDETVSTRYLSLQLERMQDEFRVLCAANAEEAFEIIRRGEESITVVMTDQRMPGQQGKELLDELKQSHPEVIRILTSAYGEVDVALGAVNDGKIFRYQTKPWRTPELLDLFREALAHHHALVAARENSRSQTDAQFAALRSKRYQRLRDCVSAVLDPIIGDAGMTDWLQALEVIQALPANTSHVRASRDTTLERDLIQQFPELIKRELSGLSLHKAEPDPLSSEQFFAELKAAEAAESQSVNSSAPSLLALFCRSLVVLLKASGMTHMDFATGSECDADVVLSTRRELHMYTHLLAPLTRISQPLLQQQVAFLLLHVAAINLGTKLTVTGGQQRFGLALRFAAFNDAPASSAEHG
ncbi:response regulator [Marinobacter sp. BGYM27]|uniref:response regulator n=1 Tax=Marinobacter sp. BGYM27 TaxID=2975597 RepID=UPI0021A5026C|nr:response regulator [Marinobacter sp. BGYM27]MDG5500256.1 response regulator [Marinobacter sp. BGYM27]